MTEREWRAEIKRKMTILRLWHVPIWPRVDGRSQAEKNC